MAKLDASGSGCWGVGLGNTRKLNRAAPGAMPRIPLGGVPRAAMIPAQWEPWSPPSGPKSPGFSPGTVHSPPETTRSGWPRAMPVSTTAIFTPWPSVVSPAPAKNLTLSLKRRSMGVSLTVILGARATFICSEPQNEFSGYTYKRWSDLMLDGNERLTVPAFDETLPAPSRAAKFVNATTRAPATGPPSACDTTFTTTFLSAAREPAAAVASLAT